MVSIRHFNPCTAFLKRLAWTRVSHDISKVMPVYQSSSARSWGKSQSQTPASWVATSVWLTQERLHDEGSVRCLSRHEFVHRPQSSPYYFIAIILCSHNLSPWAYLSNFDPFCLKKPCAQLYCGMIGLAMGLKPNSTNKSNIFRCWSMTWVTGIDTSILLSISHYISSKRAHEKRTKTAVL